MTYWFISALLHKLRWVFLHKRLIKKKLLKMVDILE